MGVNRDEGGQKADEIEGTRFVLSSFGFIRSFSKPRLIVVALAPAEECRTGSNLRRRNRTYPIYRRTQISKSAGQLLCRQIDGFTRANAETKSNREKVAVILRRYKDPSVVATPSPSAGCFLHSSLPPGA